MMKSKKEWMECISYGVAGLFSLSMFVFGAMFPEYAFVRECYGRVCLDKACYAEEYDDRTCDDSACENRGEAEGILVPGSEEEKLRITCLSYEYLKEIINEWN